jgi:hypothetical protein
VSRSRKRNKREKVQKQRSGKLKKLVDGRILFS